MDLSLFARRLTSRTIDAALANETDSLTVNMSTSKYIIKYTERVKEGAETIHAKYSRANCVE